MITEIFCFALALLFIFEILYNVRKRKDLPPGPINWPVIGSTIQLSLADGKYPHIAMEKLSKKYGDVMSLGIGVHPAVMLSSYQAMKEILTKDDALGRYVFPFVTDRALTNSFGIIWGNAIMWRDIRKYTTAVLRDFGYGKKASMESVLQQGVKHMIASIERKSTSNEGVYDVNPHDFAASSANNLWCFVGGFRFDQDDATFQKMMEHNKMQMEIASSKNIYVVFPFLRQWFPKWTNHDKHVAAHKELQEFMREMIRKKRDKRRVGSETVPSSFIEVFLNKIEDESRLSEPNTIFTEEQLILILMDLFFGGTETTGTFFNWAIALLVLNPKVQRRIQIEIEQIVPLEENISLKHISKMVYTKAAIYELMRVSNVAPIPPGRMAIKDIFYKSFKIPKGTLVMWNMEPVMKDKEFWGDAEMFRPERFLNEEGTELLQTHTERVAIFGFGKRLCIGQGFASDTISIYLTNFLRLFNLDEVPGREPCLKNPIFGNVVNPRPYSVKFKRRI